MMAAVSKGLFGGRLPWGVIALGGSIGIAVILLDEWLRARRSSFRTPVLAVAVGIYLPLYISTTIFLGGALAHLATRGRPAGERESLGGRGMLFAAGLVAGESLTGVLLAIPIVLSGRADVAALPAAMRPGEPAASLLGLALTALVSVLLLRVARSRPAA